MTHDNWCDDERARGYTSHRVTERRDCIHPLGWSLCRDIAKGLDTYKSDLVWNEVEYINYQYEFAPPLEEDDNASCNGEHMPAITDSITELNSECLDPLIKNQTAYT